MRSQLRCVAIALVTMFVFSSAEAQGVIADPEELAGPWETNSSAVTDSFFISITSHVTFIADRPGITAQRMLVRVYHREYGEETWGWYIANLDGSGSKSNGGAFDGSRLRIENPTQVNRGYAPFSLSIAWDPSVRRWSGTLFRDGVMQEVAFERPAADRESCALCGSWINVAAQITRRLHIYKSADGTVNAWRDDRLTGLTAGSASQTAGNRLRVTRSTPRGIEMSTESAMCCDFQFIGELSDDGRELVVLTEGGKPGTLRLAPMVFMRMPTSY